MQRKEKIIEKSPMRPNERSIHVEAQPVERPGLYSGDTIMP